MPFPFAIGAGITLGSSLLQGIAGAGAAKAQASAEYRRWQEQDLQNIISIRQYNRQAARETEESREAYRNQGKAFAEEYALSRIGITYQENDALRSYGIAAGDLIAKNAALTEAKGGGNEQYVIASSLNALNTLSTIQLNAAQSRRDAAKAYDRNLASRNYRWVGAKTYIPGSPPPKANTSGIILGSLVSGAMAVGGGIMGGGLEEND